MSKVTDHYQQIADTMGLRLDPTYSALYGSSGRYDIVMSAPDGRYPYRFCIQLSAKRPDALPLSKEERRELVKSLKPITACNQNDNIIRIFFTASAKPQKLLTAVSDVFQTMNDFLMRKGFDNCCSSCGSAVETESYRVALDYMMLCPECASKVETNMLFAAQVEQNKKENIIGGIVGALLGSLIGVLSLFLISRLGYVSVLSGIIMAVCVLKGYELLGGKITKKGILISLIVMLVMVYIGDHLDVAYLIYTEIGGTSGGYSFFECYQLIPQLLDSGIIDRSAYTAHLILLYLFSLLGALPTIYTMVSRKKQETVIRKLTTVK